MTDRVIAVVVTYSRKDLLKECLDSLYRQTYKLDKIILIDNASTDGTVSFVNENYCDGLLECVQMGSNIGGAGGFCEGLRLARDLDCDWIWVMDDDTIPADDALDMLISSAHDIDERFSFLSSCVYGPGREPMNVPNVSEARGENGYRDWYRHLKNRAVKLADATFVSTLIRKEAVLKCGLPCGDYFIWGDDTEYTMRLIKHYGPGFLIGSSEVIHKRPDAKRLALNEETSLSRIRMYRYFYRNNLINKRLYLGRQECLRFLYRAVKMSFRSLSTSYGWAKFSAVYKGILGYLTQKKAVLNYISEQLESGDV